MKLKQTVKGLIASSLIALSINVAILQPAFAAKCGGVDTSILSCGGKRNAKNVEDTGVWRILLIVINIMTGLIGVLAIGGIVYGSILYVTAEDRDAQVQKAKQTIFNVLLGLVLYAGMFAILQFLIPGGIFKT